MRYNDYPENYSNIIVEKLNNEYKKEKNVSALQGETESAPSEQPSNSNSAFNQLTYEQILSNAQTLSNALTQNIEYLNGYLARTPNRSEQEILIRAINLLNENRKSIDNAFSVSATAPILSTGFTRRCLKEQILKLYYDIIYYSIILFGQNPSNFGLQNLNINNLNSLFDFISITL